MKILTTALLVTLFLWLSGCAHQHAAAVPNDPVLHPGTQTESTVHHLIVFFTWANVLCVLALAASIGVFFTPLGMLSRFAVPIAGSGCVVTLFSAITLPYWPWVFGIGAGVVLVLLVVETIKRIKLAKAGTPARPLLAELSDVEAKAVNELHDFTWHPGFAGKEAAIAAGPGATLSGVQSPASKPAQPVPPLAQ